MISIPGIEQELGSAQLYDPTTVFLIQEGFYRELLQRSLLIPLCGSCSLSDPFSPRVMGFREKLTASKHEPRSPCSVGEL